MKFRSDHLTLEANRNSFCSELVSQPIFMHQLYLLNAMNITLEVGKQMQYFLRANNKKKEQNFKINSICLTQKTNI